MQAKSSGQLQDLPQLSTEYAFINQNNLTTAITAFKHRKRLKAACAADSAGDIKCVHLVHF